jgi:hypothetical protein
MVGDSIFLKITFPKRWLSNGLTLGLTYLCLAVFTWGLQYKLSLYQHIDGSTDIPAAKLLTGDKASIHSNTVDTPQSPATFELCLLLVSFAVFLAQQFTVLTRTRQDRLQRGNYWKLHRYSFLQLLFFRPPPAYL